MFSKWKQAMLLAALVLPVGLTQAAGNIQGKRFGDWGGQCETAPDNSQVCYLQQVLSEKGQKTPLMVTVIGYGQGKKFPTAIFELPKGVDMKQGVQLRVDRYNPVGFSGKCDNVGCRAGFTLDNPLTQQFSKGKRVLVAFKKHGQKDPIIYPVSLNGIPQGLQAIR
ncbi:MAG: invasion associated locus B family protein [Thiolinea sp.]